MTLDNSELANIVCGDYESDMIKLEEIANKIENKKTTSDED